MFKEKKQAVKPNIPTIPAPPAPDQSGHVKQAKGIAEAVSAAKELLGKDGRIIRAGKTDGGWEIEIEVVEQSEYMKKIGIPKPVYDRDIYLVVLDHDLNLLSYERQGQRANKPATSTSQ